ncbi:hypothetical protein SELMODRAFT_99824, partial [Selaginella moellendorffii]
MGVSTAPLADWPWETLGNLKYIMFAPFVAKAAHSHFFAARHSSTDSWWFHLVLLVFLRYLQQQAWITVSRLYFLVKKYQIQQFALSYEQVDREFHCDNHMIFQSLALAAAHVWIPAFRDLPLFNWTGLLLLVFFHVVFTEPIYYFVHRAMHSSHILFCNYHSLHHASTTPEPATAGTRTFLEELIQSALIAIPIIGVMALGGGSVVMIYVYLLSFDFFKQLGHCNL